MVKNLPAVQETWVQSLGWEDPLEKEMVTHSSILPGGSHGQRSLVGYSPWSCTKLDKTEQLTLPCVSPSKVQSVSCLFYMQFSSVQSAQLCPALCDPMDCSMPGLPVHHLPPELTQTHVHWVSGAIQPSHPLSFPSPPAFDFSQHQGCILANCNFPYIKDCLTHLCLLCRAYHILFHTVQTIIVVLSHVQLFVTPLTTAHQVPPSMEFSRQEYWSELPFPIPGDLLNPGIEVTSLASPALAGRCFTTAPPGKPFT